jgi:hypothetical protein
MVFAAAQQKEVTWSLFTLHSASFQTHWQCGYFIPLDTFVRHIAAEYAARFETNIYSQEILSGVIVIYCVVTLWTLWGKYRWSVRYLMLHWLHKVWVNTDCDCGDSQADPPFVTVALGEFIGVKSRSCNCRFLKIYFDSKEIDGFFMSGPTCCQTSIYLRLTDIAYRVLK